MKLNVRDLGGDGAPWLVLHGLYGSSRNWQRVGKRLAAVGRVLAVDLRNHGQSPHAPDCSYEAMASDVLEVMDGLSEPAHLMGHSLGGKVAMRVACDVGSQVRSLQVLDIAPRQYDPDAGLLDALLSLELDGFTGRSQIDEKLAEKVPDQLLRGFLLTNLQRTESGGFAWQANLGGLRQGLDEIGQSPLRSGDHYSGPVDVIAGGASHYVVPEDAALFTEHFPNSRLHVLGRSWPQRARRWW